jgi:hypothetical protein
MAAEQGDFINETEESPKALKASSLKKVRKPSDEIDPDTGLPYPDIQGAQEDSWLPGGVEDFLLPALRGAKGLKTMAGMAANKIGKTSLEAKKQAAGKAMVPQPLERGDTMVTSQKSAMGEPSTLSYTKQVYGQNSESPALDYSILNKKKKFGQ